MTMTPGLDLSFIDSNTRPQDDLFRHVNGVWLDTYEIPADQAVHGSFYVLRDASEAAVKEILEEAQASPKPGVSQQIGDMYGSFLDEERVNALGAAPIAADLERFGIAVHSVTPQEYGQACGLLQDSLDQNLLVHRNEPQLNAAIVGAGRRQAGDTWTWSRRSSKVDISPLVAATLAHWAHRQNREPAAAAVVNLADFLEDE